MGLVRTVSVGASVEAAYATIGLSAIEKHPVSGPVHVHALGLDGDQVGDPRHHGGLDQAVYAYAREDLDFWESELGPSNGAEIPDGGFGENLTTSGIDVNAAEIGERWRIGEALLEVRSIRTPCATFRGWQGRNGFDTTSWQKRFTAAARPGPYLRVLGEGSLSAGDEIEVVHRPGHGVTVATMFCAVTTDSHLLPGLLRVEDLLPEVREQAERYAASTRRSSRER